MEKRGFCHRVKRETIRMNIGAMKMKYITEKGHRSETIDTEHVRRGYWSNKSAKEPRIKCITDKNMGQICITEKDHGSNLNAYN